MIVRSACLVFVLITSAAGQETRGAIQGGPGDSGGAFGLRPALERARGAPVRAHPAARRPLGVFRLANEILADHNHQLRTSLEVAEGSCYTKLILLRKESLL